MLDSQVDFIDRQLNAPLLLSTGAISQLTEARVRVAVRTSSGKEAEGRGNIYLSDLWAWPHADLPHSHRDARLRELTREISDQLWTLCGGEQAHPLELGLRLHSSVCHRTPDAEPPVLARAMCVSPFDAALHDAVGQALNLSAFDFYREACELPSARSALGAHPAEMIQRSLKRRDQALPAWVILGKNDDLAALFDEWVRRRGYFCFKVKIMGVNPAEDASRVSDVHKAACRAGVPQPQISADSNEANPDPESVTEFLDILQSQDTAAYGALQYLEQPTARDIREHAFDWRDVARRKDVMLDEGLTDLEILPLAREQGWSGLAIKTCKGHSFALVAAAWAASHGMKLTMQDLTNPGYSGIHAALFANAVGASNGVEINSPQFTPTANAQWLPRLAGLFDPVDGRHTLADWRPAGLGSSL